RRLRVEARLRALLVLGGDRRGTRARSGLVPGAAAPDLVLDRGRGRDRRDARVIKLYVIPASHPSLAAELMLQRKGIDFKRRDLITSMHIPILKAMGFPGRTVPALKADGRKVQGSRAIARFLDELKPEPP